MRLWKNINPNNREKSLMVRKSKATVVKRNAANLRVNSTRVKIITLYDKKLDFWSYTLTTVFTSMYYA